MLISRLMRCVGAAFIGVAALSACGSDGPDAYTAPDAAEADGGESAASGSDDPDSGAGAGAAPAEPGATVEVKALDNTFIEETVEVAAGTEIVWKNGGRNDHDVVPVAEGESWGVAIDAFHPGDEYSHVFTEPGEYAYYCTIHGTADVGMTGTIVVD